MSEPMKLRGKYRQAQTVKSTPYRTRTGPNCCNSGCGRKKNRINWRKGSGRG